MVRNVRKENTSMKNIEKILQNTEMARLMLNAFQHILDDNTDMLFVKDSNLVYRAANLPFVRMVGKERLEDVIGHSDFEIFDDHLLAQRYVADDRRLIADAGDMVSFVEPITEKDGSSRFARTTKYVLRDPDGAVIGLAGISRDITGEIAARENHEREIAYLFDLPEDAYFAAYIDITDWRIIGERIQEVEGAAIGKHENIEVLARRACRNVADRRGPAYLFYRDFLPGILQDVHRSGQRNIVLEYLRRFEDGGDRWVRDEIKFLTDPSSGHLCLMLLVRDIHRRKQEEISLLWAAERDDMTGMLNRASMIRYAKDFLNGAGRNDTHAMFMIDMDNFKQINDTYGHREGDRFLAKIAGVIRGSFRDSDLVGRIGGDEFLILMKYVPDDRVVREKGRNLLNAIQNACADLQHLRVSCSIGVSVYDQDCETFENLYERADRAMYRSKRSGKSQLVFAAELEEPV